MELENRKSIKVGDKQKPIYRYIMEKHLGRELKPGEVVHHINRNDRDNRIENLIVMNSKDHNKLHGLIKQIRDKETIFYQLKVKIVEKGIDRKALAKLMNTTTGRLNIRLNGDTRFSEDEIQSLIKILNIKEEEIEEMFKDNKPLKIKEKKIINEKEKVRIELNKRIKEEAEKLGITRNEYMLLAVQEKIKRDKKSK